MINNKVGLMGDLALSMVESSGQLESKRVEYAGEGDGLTCRVTLQRKGRQAQTYDTWKATNPEDEKLGPDACDQEEEEPEPLW